MNFLPLILGFLLLKAMPSFGFGNNGKNQNSQEQNSRNGSSDKGIFGDGIFNNLENAQQALQLISLFNKIKDNKADLSDIMGEIMSNPLAMSFISKMGFGGQQNFDAQPCNEEPSFGYKTPPQENNEEVAQTEQTQCKTDINQPANNDADRLERDEKQSDGQVFETAKSPADTLFKPVENIAGIELTKQLKKYYENWYII